MTPTVRDRRSPEVPKCRSDRLPKFVLGRAAQRVLVGEEQVDRDADQGVLGDPLVLDLASPHQRSRERGEGGVLVLPDPRLFPGETRELWQPGLRITDHLCGYTGPDVAELRREVDLRHD